MVGGGKPPDLNGVVWAFSPSAILVPLELLETEVMCHVGKAAVAQEGCEFTIAASRQRSLRPSLLSDEFVCRHAGGPRALRV